MKRLVRILFSRYFISALIILLELVGIGYVCFELSVYSIYFFIAAELVNVIILFYILNTDTNPEYKLSWAFAIVFIPILGGLLFILFYHRRMSKAEQRRARLVVGALSEYSLDESALGTLAAEDRAAAGKALAILGDDPMVRLVQSTESEYFGTGEGLFGKMLSDISEAERFVFLEYFIISEGEMWDGIFSLLMEKAACGVEVRVMYDDIGCMGRLPSDFKQKMQNAGIRVLTFSRVTPRASAVHNNRDHRKICVIDGKIGYTGGVNIGDEYINKSSRLGHWKDGGIRLFGEASSVLTSLFLLQWGLVTGEYENLGNYLAPHKIEGDGGYYLPFGSGPFPLYRIATGKRAIMDIVNQARRYVFVSTPYLIIDFDLTEALIGAARRGVDVKIVTPRVPDKKTVKLMTKSAYPHLIENGVKIYEYTPGFIHEKLVLSDDEYALIGTINLDYRSLVHHYEDGVWIYKAPMIEKVLSEFRAVLALSSLVEKSEVRLTVIERFVRALVRLFAPLL